MRQGQEQAQQGIQGQQQLPRWPGWAPQGLAPDAPTKQEEKQTGKKRCKLAGPRVAMWEGHPPCPGWAPQGLAPAARVGKRRLRAIEARELIGSAVWRGLADPESVVRCLWKVVAWWAC